MKRMFFANICNAEIIDDECELYWSPFVLPKAWDELALVVAAFIESFLEEFVCQEACLREAVHALIGFFVDHYILRHS